jgi:hypothetical protein
MLSVLKRPPDRCWATALAIAGFSATQRIFCGIIHVDGSLGVMRGQLDRNNGAWHTSTSAMKIRVK